MLTTIPLGIIDSAGGRQYATWSSTNKNSNIALSNNNLTFKTSTLAIGTKLGNGITTIGKSSGKWYWEITVDSASSSGNTLCGLSDSFNSANVQVGAFTNSIAYRQNAGSLNQCFLKNSSYTGTGTGCITDLSAGMTLGFALDVDPISPTLKFYINGTQVGPTQNLAVGRTWYPACGANGIVGDGGTANFGGSAFVYAVPVGYNQGVYNI